MQRYNFDAQGEVGAGGFGRVFVAEDRHIGHRRVAVKQIISSSDEALQSFETEVKLMKELDHPNICKIFETYEKDDARWVVMEYCAGGTVFDAIVEHGPLEEQFAKDVVAQVASVLKYSHGRGVAHRDVKPENICFCERGRSTVKVIDWGVGLSFSVGSAMFGTAGSEPYKAPEVLSGTACGYTASCDVWSLGVTTYMMLSGKPPFWGSSEKQLRRMLREQYPLSGGIWEDISEAAKGFLVGALKADPAERMTVEQALAHPWVVNDRPIGTATSAFARAVLTNVISHSKSSEGMFQVCIAAVANQLDYRSLKGVHQVFCEIDADGDGELSFAEVSSYFERHFGAGSSEVRDVVEAFTAMDLDGSGAVGFTAFCAAALGASRGGRAKEPASRAQQALMWQALDTLYLRDDATVTSDDIVELMISSGLGPRILCSEVALLIEEEIRKQRGPLMEGPDCDALTFEELDEYSGDGSLGARLQVAQCASRRVVEEATRRSQPIQKFMTYRPNGGEPIARRG